MTTTIQTSAINIQLSHRSRRTNAYSIIINGEDGNYQEYEVEAASDREAHAKADSLAQENMIDVTYVEVYKIA
jgi:hypothetical protein